jgi:hypothetical protein
MCLPPPHLRTETDPIYETLCSIEYRTMDKVQKLSNPKCYTPSSELLEINFFVWNKSVSNDGNKKKTSFEADLYLWQINDHKNPSSSPSLAYINFSVLFLL